VEPSDFRNAVGGAGIKRRMFMLRDFGHIAEHFTGSGKVKVTVRDALFQGRKDEMGAIDIGADGRKFILKGVADKPLRSQMVTFIWLHPVDHLEEARIAVERGGVEHQPVMIEEMAEAPEPVLWILKGHASDYPVHFVVLAQQPLRKIGAILP